MIHSPGDCINIRANSLCQSRSRCGGGVDAYVVLSRSMLRAYFRIWMSWSTSFIASVVNPPMLYSDVTTDFIATRPDVTCAIG